MNYELAKRLKDAGWPQPEYGKPVRGEWIVEPGAFNDVYAPSTDELIEALGDCFTFLHRTRGALTFVANSNVRLRGLADIGCALAGGAKPDIALAELWLTPEVQEALGRNRLTADPSVNA